MRVDVTFRNLSPSVPLRGYAVDKVSRLSRFLTRPIDGWVTLETDGYRHVVEASIREAGAVFTATDSSQRDMYAAIDAVADKLRAQATRNKGKGPPRGAPRLQDALSRAVAALAEGDAPADSEP